MRRPKKASRFCVTGLCPVTGEFPTQKANNAEKASISWRHHGTRPAVAALTVCVDRSSADTALTMQDSASVLRKERLRYTILVLGDNAKWNVCMLKRPLRWRKLFAFSQASPIVMTIFEKNEESSRNLMALPVLITGRQIFICKILTCLLSFDDVTDRFHPHWNTNDVILIKFSQRNGGRLALSRPSNAMMTSSNGNIFRVTWPLCGEFTVPVNSQHKGQWRGALMFSVICVWINGWVNEREAGDLRRHRGHYDVIVMATVFVASLDMWKKQMRSPKRALIFGLHFKSMTIHVYHAAS